MTKANPAPETLHDHDKQGQRKWRKMLRRLETRPLNAMTNCQWVQNFRKRQEA